jgi:hypothetical protein
MLGQRFGLDPTSLSSMATSLQFPEPIFAELPAIEAGFKSEKIKVGHYGYFE